MKDKSTTGLSSVVGQEFSPLAAMGGIRGVIETVVPSLLFIIVFAITKELVLAIMVSLVTAGVLVVARLIQRIDITPALGGVLGIVISSVWAWRSGEASRYFELGLWTNAGYGLAFLISILATWPLLGVLVSYLRGHDQSWRTDPNLRGLKRRYYVATWLWVVLFAIRLAIQLPLYLADNVEALGIARLVMGPFLFALVAWFTWMLCRHDDAAQTQPETHDDQS